MLAEIACSLYDKVMDREIVLTPEIRELIRRHLGHGCANTPESVLLRALQALQDHETMQSRHDQKESDEKRTVESSDEAVSGSSSDEGVLRQLTAQGAVRWNGGKPKGLRGVHVRGKPVSDTVLDARR